MFTGIVTHRGSVVACRVTEGDGRRLVLSVEPPLEGVSLGDSIACDGVCLTVSELTGAGLAFDVVPETLRKTTLGERSAGDTLNLEPSLHLGDEMGGHLVQGHVEGTGVVTAVEREGEDVRMTVRVDERLAGGLIPKGSVALDGVSLTIGEVWQTPEDGDGARFSVYLVPHTLAVTSLGRREIGNRLNVEPDVMGRWVEHHVRRMLQGRLDPAES